MGNFFRYFLLVVLAFIWGSSFILMKKGLLHFSSIEVAGLRLTSAGLCLLPFSLAYLRQIKAKDIFPLLVVAFIGNLIPYTLFAFAQTKLESAITGMLNSLVPLFTLIVGLIIYGLKPRWVSVVGVITGLAGAVLLIVGNGKGFDDKGNLYGILVILATICYAISVNVLKARLSHMPALATAALPLSFLAIPIGIYLLLQGHLSQIKYTEEVIFSLGAIITLGIIGTAVAMILFNRLIQLASAVFASSVTYLIPIVALMWGIVDGEKIHLLQYGGMALVIVAVYLINAKSRKIG